MKYINILTYLNRIVFSITGILYLTIILGLYAQIVLGATQLLTGLILLCLWMKLSKKHRERLLKYWFFVGVYAVLWYTEWFLSLKGDFLQVVIFIIIPLSIAVYMTVILESLKVKKS